MRRTERQGRGRDKFAAAGPVFTRSAVGVATPKQLALILRKVEMKAEIHPNYVTAHVRCTCGNEFTTRSTNPDIKVEICSNCHPFYTGRQKLVDSGGRVERFQRKLARRAKT